MRSASSVLLAVIAVGLLINFMQGGPERVRRWSVRHLTGKDLVGGTS